MTPLAGALKHCMAQGRTEWVYNFRVGKPRATHCPACNHAWPSVNKQPVQGAGSGSGWKGKAQWGWSPPTPGHALEAHKAKGKQAQLGEQLEA